MLSSNKIFGGSSLPLFFLFLLLTSPLFSETSVQSSNSSALEKTERYVEWLVDNGDYYRAISELRKIQWYSDRSLWFEIELQLLSLYQLSGHINEGLIEWKNFTRLHPSLIKDEGKWFLARARLLLTQGNYSSVYPLLTTISVLPEGKKLASLLKTREKILLSPSPEDRSPLLAGILSAVVPGAGEWYAGLQGNGVFTFFVVALLGAGSYYLYVKSSPAFYVVLPITVMFYAGNIYGAVTSTYRMNLIRRNQEWETIKTTSNWDMLLQIKF